MLFTKESERCRWRWRCCCTVSAALSLPAVRCLCSRLREARTFNTPSQPSPAQTSPAVVVCREPLLSPPQHHYLLPQLPPTLPPTQGTYCTDSLPSSVSVDSLLSALITLSYLTTTYHYLLPPTRYLLLPDLTSPTKLLDHVHVHIHIHAHAHVHHLHLHLPVCHACPQSHARTPSAATAAAAAPACFTSLHAWALLIPDLTLPYPPSIAV